MPDFVPPSDPVGADRVRRSFQAHFGSKPSAVAFAPGRVNLIGDHIDYCGGCVLPVALPLGCWVAIGPDAGAAQLQALALDLGAAHHIDSGDPLHPDRLTSAPKWFRYVAGAFQLTRAVIADHGGPVIDGACLALHSTVPLGSGLSSSAALEVSVATAVEALTRHTLDPLAKARLCQRAEHDYADVPCGLMDQAASVAGRAGHALLIDCHRQTIEPTALPAPSKAAFWLIDTRVRHDNTGGAYANRRAACAAAERVLGIHPLSHARQADLERNRSALTPPELAAARHVITEHQRVLNFVAALRAVNLKHAGDLMFESHQSLAQTYRVSCPEADALVDELRNVPGVYGARMTGAGFGGWVVALADSSADPEAIARCAAPNLIDGIDPTDGVEPTSRLLPTRCLRVIPSGGARIHPS